MAEDKSSRGRPLKHITNSKIAAKDEKQGTLNICKDSTGNSRRKEETEPDITKMLTQLIHKVDEMSGERKKQSPI